MIEYKRSITTTFKVGFVAFNALAFNSGYRKVRASMPDKKDRCHFCDKQFEGGELMTIVGTNKGNHVMHAVCAAGVCNIPTDQFRAAKSGEVFSFQP